MKTLTFIFIVALMNSAPTFANVSCEALCTSRDSRNESEWKDRFIVKAANENDAKLKLKAQCLKGTLSQFVCPPYRCVPIEDKDYLSGLQLKCTCRDDSSRDGCMAIAIVKVEEYQKKNGCSAPISKKKTDAEVIQSQAGSCFGKSFGTVTCVKAVGASGTGAKTEKDGENVH